MSEIHSNEIIYEEGWRQSAPPTDYSENEDTPIDEVPEKPDEQPDSSKPLLITVQLIICLLAALALFLMKSMDSDFYHVFMDYYRDELEKPVISQGVFDALDVSRLFGESAVSITSTPDEAADF